MHVVYAFYLFGQQTRSGSRDGRERLRDVFASVQYRSTSTSGSGSSNIVLCMSVLYAAAVVFHTNALPRCCLIDRGLLFVSSNTSPLKVRREVHTFSHIGPQYGRQIHPRGLKVCCPPTFHDRPFSRVRSYHKIDSFFALLSSLPPLCDPSVNSIMPGRQAWGDDDDDDYLPPRQESAVDSKGVKSIVEYHFNTNGAKVRAGAWLTRSFARFREAQHRNTAARDSRCSCL